MQVASEMFSKLRSLAESASQSLDLQQSPAVSAMKQQLQYLLSAAVHFMQTAGIRVPVGSVQGEGTGQQQMSPLRRAVSVVMDLLHKIKTVSLYLYSSVYYSTVSIAGRLVESLRTKSKWNSDKSSVRGKNTVPAAVDKKQVGKSSVVVHTTPEAHTRPLETCLETQESKEEEKELHSEESAITETAETRRVDSQGAEESVKQETSGSDTEEGQSSQTVTDNSPSQQPLEEKASLHQENEASSATMRPHSKTFSSIFRRSSKTKARTSSINQ